VHLGNFASDVVARIGGDEFLIVLGNLAEKEIAMAIAEKIIRSVRQPMKVANSSVKVTVSIGVAMYPDHGKTPELLILAADRAMYKVKKTGKNQVGYKLV